MEYYDLDGFEIHDDWGSQRSPFFSADAAREIFLPEMKRFVDHVHSKGKFCNLHSCGHIQDRCDVFAACRFRWMVSDADEIDTFKLYETYGDRITIGAIETDPDDPATASEEEQQKPAARRFLEKFSKEGKVAVFSAFYNKPGMLTPAFREEL